LVVYIIYINDARPSKYQIMKVYLLIKYIKNVLWRLAKRLSYIEDARCLKIKSKCKHVKEINYSTAVSPKPTVEIVTFVLHI